MSPIDPHKKALVADIIRRLHAGLSVGQAKERILREVGRLTSAEITEIEQSLIDDGVSPEEIRRFCNVHALLFEEALEKTIAEPDAPSHPLALLAAENQEIRRITAALRDPQTVGDPSSARRLLEQLRGVDRHYALKENALFPALERNGFPGPSKVMWSKHNEVRAMLKEALAATVPSAAVLEPLLAEVDGMVNKEEDILFPASRERIPGPEWVDILRACDEIGFFYINGAGLHATLVESESRAAAPMDDATVVLPTGRFALEELRAMLDTLPVDITFVDADDKVRYFSESKDRTFVRARSVIGRDVHNCHPPQSVHKVKKIISDFRSGARDHADFWIDMHGKFLFIRYFAVRDKQRKYLGTLEVTQDLTEIRKLAGERRLLEDS
ncbi:MAG TPA: DUF438 domain-containing protein [Spirochaetia bacterium]|nr:DUF438 domain-containing protein [Spirochaetia bacterium]